MMNDGMSQLQSLFDGLSAYLDRGAQVDIANASGLIAEQARKALGAGLNTNGSPMTPLKKSTLEGPVRRDGDPTIRRHYGATPMVASGKTADSIVSKKSGPNEWEISSNTDRGDMILYSNAKLTHGGSPFAGDTPKARRDPLQVADKHMDILETQLMRGIDRALNG